VKPDEPVLLRLRRKKQNARDDIQQTAAGRDVAQQTRHAVFQVQHFCLVRWRRRWRRVASPLTRISVRWLTAHLFIPLLKWWLWISSASRRRILLKTNVAHKDNSTLNSPLTYLSSPDWASPDWAFPDWAFPDREPRHSSSPLRSRFRPLVQCSTHSPDAANALLL